MNQTERIISILETDGAITSFDAFEEIGCTRLSARIYDIRQTGVDVRSLSVNRKNRFGDAVTFFVYYLPGYELMAYAKKRKLERVRKKYVTT